MSLLQVVPLGGCGEIGKNCTAVVQGEEIIVVDCGLSFPHEEQYGVDIVIPDMSWLVENKKKVKALVLTHAHEDHVGAIPYFLQILPDVPIYATPFTEALVRSKLQEKARNIEPNIKRMSFGDVISIGEMSVEPIRITHSIPETAALAIRTSHGIILFTADYKFDFSPVDKKLTNIKRFAELGEEGVLLLLSDSTNVDRKGWSLSESVVGRALEEVFAAAPGRVMVTTFSSNIHRMQQVVNAAKKTGRKVAIAGRRMDSTVALCQSMKYLDMPPAVYVKIDEIGKYAPGEVVILVTGSQGEPMAALSQMSRQEHRFLKIEEGDTILYSARPIPGNEGAIYRTVNRLIHLGAHVILEHDSPIHASGHGHQEELKMMVNLTQPFYVAPVHGEPRHQKLFERMLWDMGHVRHRIFLLANGDILNIDENKAWKAGHVRAGEILIDQAGGQEVGDRVLRERFNMAHHGVVIVAVEVDQKSGTFVGKPTLSAKGFCGEAKDLDSARAAVMDSVKGLSPAEVQDQSTLEDALCEPVRRIIGKEARQKPEVIPIILRT
ncbi:MAG: ribonuclease J [Fimbriimonadaceae bacterium]|nr:ribonuclease J [Fimbriimonadaceae bacterium]